MAGNITTATSSLASELLLNKIMNGQVQTSTGKSVTAAGRAVSNRLSATAYELRTAEKNMSYGEGYVSAAQSEVTSAKDQLNSLKKSLLDVMGNKAANATDFKTVGKALSEGAVQVSKAIAGAKYNGTELFTTAAAMTFNAGNGLSISVLGDKITEDTALVSAIAAAKAVSSSATATTASQKIDSAIAALEQYEAKYGESIKALQNRQLLLADQGASLDSTAAAQSVASMSGASNLLSGILGETEA